MKKKIVSMIMLIVILTAGTCSAASYTLPEKMTNQLAIGSGLKGTFTVTAEGHQFSTPFLNAITDAEWAVRGILSGKDLHYFVFQSNEKEEQSALTELYRKEGIYYLRSDMVQGKILVFPVLSQCLDALFPTSGENDPSTSFVSKIIELPESVRKEKWDPVMQRYQNELEMWLADFTVKADTVKMENGLSALDFSYEIPMDSINTEIVKLFGEFSADQDVNALLQTVMTEDEKRIYLNSNLLYYYSEALNSLQIDKPVRMSKRVSAIGDLLRFRLELPLDERTTGYQSIDIETVNQLTVLTLKKTGQVIVAAFPEIEKFKQSSYEQSLWIARINEEPEKLNENLSVRIDIKKTQEIFEKDEKTHENDHYDVTIIQDTSYLPGDADLSLLPEYEGISMQIDLHYSSKYAQNSATTLEISADISKKESSVKIYGKLKTAAPWLFMPFEIIDPIEVGTDKEAVLDPYITDWISNAASMVHHSTSIQNAEEGQDTEQEQNSNASAVKNEADDTDNTDHDAETVPLTDPE